MASEIRANKQTNRVGLGTVTYTDTGIIVSGIVTANSFSGGTSGISTISGVVNIANDLNVDGHTELDNANIAGVVTFRNATVFMDVINVLNVKRNIGVLKFQSPKSAFFNEDGTVGFVTITSGAGGAGGVGGLEVSGIVTATSFSGDGSALSNLPASAPVGGASTNSVFFENDTAVAVNYQITSGKNAMSAGPLAINAGIAVTVPSGSSWTIV